MEQVTESKGDLMNPKDVEIEFGVPVGTLRYYRSTNNGPASFRLAGRIRYWRSDVIAWIAAEEQASRRGGVIQHNTEACP